MKMIRLKDVIDKTGLSRSTIYRLVNQGDIPQPIKLTEKTSVWILSEVDEFLERKVKEYRESHA